MEELRNCPFCGGEVKLKMKRDKEIGCWVIWCECEKCHAKTRGYCPSLSDEDKALGDIEKCKKLAIEAWNRRVK